MTVLVESQTSTVCHCLLLWFYTRRARVIAQGEGNVMIEVNKIYGRIHFDIAVNITTTDKKPMAAHERRESKSSRFSTAEFVWFFVCARLLAGRCGRVGINKIKSRCIHPRLISGEKVATPIRTIMESQLFLINISLLSAHFRVSSQRLPQTYDFFSSIRFAEVAFRTNHKAQFDIHNTHVGVRVSRFLPPLLRRGALEDLVRFFALMDFSC